MKRFYLLLIYFFFLFHGTSQVVIGGNQKTTKSTENKKESLPKNSGNVTDGATTLYFLANRSNTTRLLKENTGLFGDTLGTRADETNLKIWSYAVGFQNRISKHFQWDGGISVVRNGESYQFIGTDTSYSYKSSYAYLGMPIRVNYVVGKQFRFYVGCGFIPQIFTGYKQAVAWKTSKNATVNETIKTKIGYSPFVLSAVVNTGFLLDFSNGWGLMVSPEIRFQLNSSYLKHEKYIHKARAYGVSFGLIRNL
jgi:hypothetical protein